MTDEFIQPLLAWYDENKRILPWRDKHNAYYTWVSEIMLQQTRVEAVKPFFERFMKALPDVCCMANIITICNIIFAVSKIAPNNVRWFAPVTRF